MVDSFKMKSTETNTCIDFGDGFIDRTAALPRLPLCRLKNLPVWLSNLSGQILVFGQNRIGAYTLPIGHPVLATI